MPYTVTKTELAGVLVLEPKVFWDDRGYFLESFNAREFVQATGVHVGFVQDNHSRSKRGVLRGLHYQIRHPQAKLIRVTQGKVFSAAVDLRRSSPLFGKWTGVNLSAENNRQLWIPEGFAHGFLVLSEAAELLYKASDYYHPEHERSLLWKDPEIGISWPLTGEPQLAPKDLGGRLLADLDVFD